jgi:hypothetical protein
METLRKKKTEMTLATSGRIHWQISEDRRATLD